MGALPEVVLVEADETASCVDIGSAPVTNPSSKYFRLASFVATTAFLHAIHRGIAVSFDVVEYQQQNAQREHLSIGQAAVCSKDQATRINSGSLAMLAAMRVGRLFGLRPLQDVFRLSQKMDGL